MSSASYFLPERVFIPIVENCSDRRDMSFHMACLVSWNYWGLPTRGGSHPRDARRSRASTLSPIAMYSIQPFVNPSPYSLERMTLVTGCRIAGISEARIDIREIGDADQKTR